MHCISNGYLRVSILLSSAFLRELETVGNFATVNEIKVSNTYLNIMKEVKKIAEGKNFSAVDFGKLNELGD